MRVLHCVCLHHRQLAKPDGLLGSGIEELEKEVVVVLVWAETRTSPGLMVLTVSFVPVIVSSSLLACRFFPCCAFLRFFRATLAAVYSWVSVPTSIFSPNRVYTHSETMAIG